MRKKRITKQKNVYLAFNKKMRQLKMITDSNSKAVDFIFAEFGRVGFRRRSGIIYCYGSVTDTRPRYYLYEMTGKTYPAESTYRSFQL